MPPTLSLSRSFSHWYFTSLLLLTRPISTIRPAARHISSSFPTTTPSGAWSIQGLPRLWPTRRLIRATLHSQMPSITFDSFVTLSKASRTTSESCLETAMTLSSTLKSTQLGARLRLSASSSILPRRASGASQRDFQMRTSPPPIGPMIRFHRSTVIVHIHPHITKRMRRSR